MGTVKVSVGVRVTVKLVLSSHPASLGAALTLLARSLPGSILLDRDLYRPQFFWLNQTNSTIIFPSAAEQ